MDKIILKSRRLGIGALVTAAAGLSCAHFPTGITDNGRGTALRRGRRHRPMVVDTSARQVSDPEIAAWNAAVDRKRAEKRRAKLSREA
jgi:hypothetical protein